MDLSLQVSWPWDMEISDYLSWLNIIIRMGEGGQQKKKKKNPEWEQYEHSVSESNAPGAEKCKGMFPLGLQKEIYSVHILIFNLMRSISDVYTP